MSVTTTSNRITYATAAVLRDYQLTHSDETSTLDTTLNAHPNPTSPQGVGRNPVDWPTEHRRIPAHRPVNTALDQSERRVFQNTFERVFIGIMFTGVALEATASKAWRATAGRFWNVAYKIGGQW